MHTIVRDRARDKRDYQNEVGRRTATHMSAKSDQEVKHCVLKAGCMHRRFEERSFREKSSRSFFLERSCDRRCLWPMNNRQ